MSEAIESTVLNLDFCAEAVASCACFNFRKASRVVTQLFDEALQPSGLRSTQFVILVSAAINDSTSIAHLARELVMDASTLNRNLRPLEKKALLQVTASNDGRRRIVSLTEEGRQAVKQAIPLWEKAQAEVVEHFGKRRWRDLLGDITEVVSVTRGG